MWEYLNNSYIMVSTLFRHALWGVKSNVTTWSVGTMAVEQSGYSQECSYCDVCVCVRVRACVFLLGFCIYVQACLYVCLSV